MPARKDPQLELEEFLSPLPDWLRKACEHGLSSLTQSELDQWEKNQDQMRDKLQQYETIVRRTEKWQEYRKNWGKIRIPLARNPPGARRKDTLANEAIQLRNSGLSYARIAQRLNKQHGQCTTKEAIRSLVRSRQKSSDQKKKL